MTLSEERMLIQSVNNYFMVDIMNKSRKRELIDIKHAFRYCMRKLGYRVADIGRMIGCDHATVIYSTKLSVDLMATDKAFTELVMIMRNIIDDFHATNKLRARVNDNIAKKSIMTTFCELLDRSSEFLDEEELQKWLDKANINISEYNKIITE